MKDQHETILGIHQMTEALEKLTKNTEAFNAAHSAYLKNDSGKFEAALNIVGIGEYCHIICRFFCRKHCGGRCFKFCPKPNRDEVDVKEILAFAKAITPLLKDENIIKRLLEITETENIEEWNEFLKKYKLEVFCYQLCILICSWHCERKCFELCPPSPLITRIGSIPTSQINTLGYGNGPSIPLWYVGSPNPSAGYGDHPFGGEIWLMGIFNMPTAVEYLVEVSSTGPAGSYSPILVGPQQGYDTLPPQLPAPCVPEPPPVGGSIPRTRSQSIGADPGWFKICELTDSDGGRFTTGEKTLLMWPSPLPDGVYHLRLRVRDGLMNTRVSSPQILLLDNTGPFPNPNPTISLQLQKPDGTLVPLKCGKVHKGDGIILITIWAFDPNMSSVSVTARGNSGLSVPVVSTSAVPLSKTYNGDITNQGYPMPTQFLWDPWNDPNIVPCCYLIYVEINDRTIINNGYFGGHSKSGWEAIEIGF